MKNFLIAFHSPHPGGGSGTARRALIPAGVLALAAAVLVVPAVLPAFGRQAADKKSEAASGPKVECVLGLEHVKHHASGTLTVAGDALQFSSDKGKADIPIASIQDLFTANDSKQVFGGLKGTVLKAGVPYEGGRVLSLFSKATEVLTVEYRDADNGFRGAIFILHRGQATVIKRELVAKGAKASIPPEAPASEEKKP
ncbi:MAG TPA: hypothetical protein VLW54_14355 [Candidatus Acidoferrales bacterium]|nr:hypothetical protein [Candidatus Acidoferrales bacterium]